MIDRQAERAQAAGALTRIGTDARTIEDGGVPFVVRRATQLRKKEGAGPATGHDGTPSASILPVDPFATPEPELFVADLSPTHYALLNKYNVLDRHLLVITREFAEQEALLDEADFSALAACMKGEPVLGFYNGGAAAGASQRHKHLQVVRLPLSNSRDLPIEAAFDGDAVRLPLRHGFVRLREDPSPGELHARYRELLRATRAEDGPYNLLVAHGWMLLVPRTRAAFDGISVNALAFAGALFVRDDDELRTVERAGPLAILQQVAFPKEPS